jgi:molecular chaperone DnaJ
VSVTYADAALGAQVEVPSLTPEGIGSTNLDIPAGTQPGTVLTLKGQGVSRLDGRGRGVLAVLVQVEVPIALSEKARTLLESLRDELRACGGASGSPKTDKS